MRFGKIFDTKDDGQPTQVMVHLDTFDPHEYGPSDTTDEYCVTVRTLTQRGTYITLRKHFASQEQAEQYLKDFDQTRADYFVEYSTVLD